MGQESKESRIIYTLAPGAINSKPLNSDPGVMNFSIKVKGFIDIITMHSVYFIFCMCKKEN